MIQFCPREMRRGKAKGKILRKANEKKADGNAWEIKKMQIKKCGWKLQRMQIKIRKNANGNYK